MPISRAVANVILHVILMATMVSGVFFLYASIVETKIVTSQVDNLVLDLTEDLKTVLSDEDKQTIETAFKNLVPPNMSDADAEARDTNNKLMKKASLVVGSLLIVGVITVLFLSWWGGFSFLDLLKENIVILLIACTTEIVFLSFFARNYKSLDPNTAKLAVVNALKSYASS